MFERLEDIAKRYDELEALLAREGSANNRREFAKLAKERSTLEEIVARYRDWKKLEQEIAETEKLLGEDDPELRDLGRSELASLRGREQALAEELKRLLVPKDPRDERNVLLEIRAGTGGEEASLFVADLFRMYSRYAERRGWKVEIMNSNATGLGGFKEIIALIEGRGAYSRLKFESGVHRVQRVPVTEASGRIHTSAVTIAVLPEAEDVEVDIADKDLKIDVMRASGPGGQSVNTTDSAVRITHLPSGIVVHCRDEKSQHKNKSKALKILRARLLEQAEAAQRSEIAAARRGMVGSGDRSERIRTYNFPQGRVSDHRVDVTIYTLDRFLDGELEAVIDALVTSNQEAAV
ncbi:MAG: peptide chain release factor 1 [Candidatus Binatia bacterium]